MKPRPREKATKTFEGAARAFRVRVDDDDKDRWSAGLTTAMALDDIVDKDHDFDSGWHYDQFLQGVILPHMTSEQAEFVHNVYDEKLSIETRERWRYAAHELGPLAVKRMQIEEVDEYVAAVRAESPLLAGVMMVDVEGERKDSIRRQKFNTWMGSLMQYTYMADTYVDMKKDYEEGNTKIKPNEQSAAVVKQAVKEDFESMMRQVPLTVYPALINHMRKSNKKAGFEK